MPWPGAGRVDSRGGDGRHQKSNRECEEEGGVGRGWPAGKCTQGGLRRRSGGVLTGTGRDLRRACRQAGVSLRRWAGSPEVQLGRGGGRSEGERSGGEAELLEDGLGGGGAEDDGHDSAGASATRATEDVGAERPLEELGPGDGVARLSGPDRLRRQGKEAASVGAAGAEAMERAIRSHRSTGAHPRR